MRTVGIVAASAILALSIAFAQSPVGPPVDAPPHLPGAAVVPGQRLFQVDANSLREAAQRQLQSRIRFRNPPLVLAPEKVAPGTGVCSVPLLRAQVPEDTNFVITEVPVRGFSDGMPTLPLPAPPCTPQQP